MNNLNQIQNDIQTLPPEAQDLLIDFIQLLKKRYPETKTENTDSSPESRAQIQGGSIHSITLADLVKLIELQLQIVKNNQ